MINGTAVKRNSNEFTIDNMTYKLNAVTAGTADETIDFLVTRDYSATTEAVKSFVDAFNKMIKTLKDLTDEKDYSADYPPLTDAQEAEMTESQIEAWNKKAKSGLLRHNADLTRLISNLKNAFYSSLGGTGKNTTSIGIAAASYFDSNAGEMVVDTAALEEALAKDPEQVVAMFTAGSSEAASSEQGLMYKLRSIMYNFNNTVRTSIATVESRISAYDETTKDLQSKLANLAERYYKKFTAMETALSRLSMQNTFIISHVQLRQSLAAAERNQCNLVILRGKKVDYRIKNLRQEYIRQSVMTASPCELIVMLYDACIKNLKLAEICLTENNNPAGAHSHLRNAQDIILELVNCLNPSVQLSSQLLEIYDFLLRTLGDMNIKKDLSPLPDILEILSSMRDTWQQISKAPYGIATEVSAG